MNIELKKTIDKMSHGIKSTGLRSSLVGNDSYYVPPLPKPPNLPPLPSNKHNIPAPAGDHHLSELSQDHIVVVVLVITIH